MNFIAYLVGTMHLGNVVSANAATNFLGTFFMFSLFGGFVADTFLGRYLTINIFPSFKLHLASPFCNPWATFAEVLPIDGTYVPVIDTQHSVLNLALYLTALEIRGLKSSVSGFGSDQFDELNMSEKKQMVKFFISFFFFISLGSLLIVTVLLYIQYNLGRWWGYGICAMSILVGPVMFVSSTRRYKFKKLVKSLLTHITAVAVAAMSKRKVSVPADPMLLYVVTDEEVEIKGKGWSHCPIPISPGKEKRPEG